MMSYRGRILAIDNEVESIRKYLRAGKSSMSEEERKTVYTKVDAIEKNLEIIRVGLVSVNKKDYASSPSRS